MVPQSVIEGMVRQIVRRFNPLRIVLFGSCARNDSKADSDVDLLVVMPDGTHTRETAIAMMSELRDADASKDIIVATPETLRRFGDSPGMIYRSALQEGRVLHERN